MVTTTEQVDSWFKTFLPSDEEKLRFMQFKDALRQLTTAVDDVLTEEDKKYGDYSQAMMHLKKFTQMINILISDNDIYKNKELYKRVKRDVEEN